MAENAILLQRDTPDLERQMAVCLPYLDQHDYKLVGRVDSHPDAVALVSDGVADVVIAASPAADDWQLARLLDEVGRPHRKGGRLEVVRALPPSGSRGYDTEDIVKRMARHGGGNAVIAQLLGVPEQRVQDILDHGKRRG